MMTDGNVSGEGFQKEFRASDVWTYYGRYLSDRSDETQPCGVGQAVSILNNLGTLGEALDNSGLIVAFADAEARAKEELERVRDRMNRPESGDLHPREEERLTAMMNRRHALGTLDCRGAARTSSAIGGRLA